MWIWRIKFRSTSLVEQVLSHLWPCPTVLISFFHLKYLKSVSVKEGVWVITHKYYSLRVIWFIFTHYGDPIVSANSWTIWKWKEIPRMARSEEFIGPVLAPVLLPLGRCLSVHQLWSRTPLSGKWLSSETVPDSALWCNLKPGGNKKHTFNQPPLSSGNNDSLSFLLVFKITFELITQRLKIRKMWKVYTVS